ncbi:putative ankyrin repeat protein RF_0381 [Haliotis cracherodii]|uniref:putative ankyrin repeat protein RF_0381 n=1 Tax=Haliotis cracherodii TaxID=6455 RepID=UPI0039EAACCA
MDSEVFMKETGHFIGPTHLSKVRAGVCAFNICEGRRCLETRAGKTACVKGTYAARGEYVCGGHNQTQRQTTVITTLIDACTVGDLPKVKYILSQDIANINKIGKKGMTPAMISAQKGHREILELLVKKGADLCLLDDDGNSILHVASKKGNVETVKYIHSQNIIDIESRGDYGITPVMFAALFGEMEVFFFLVKMGADLSKLDDDGENILHLSSRGGDAEIVNFVLKRNVVDINSDAYDGVTPLLLAAYLGRRQVFDLLIERGANTSAVDYDHDNILHYSCRGGDVEMVNYVLTHKFVDINSRTNTLQTPVLVAAMAGKTKVFQLLIKRGADIAKTHDSTKLLEYACKSGAADLVKCVLNLPKVDINCDLSDGATPLLYVALLGNTKVFKLLVRKGADVTKVDDYKENILHRSCKKGNLEIVRYVLTQNMVDINSKQGEGMTAVLLAAQSGTRDVFDLLTEEGADLSVVNTDGENVLHLACREGNEDIVKYVLSHGMVDITAINKKKLNAAMIARKHGYLSITKLLSQVSQGK